MTDNEIIKALECCGIKHCCEKCPYKGVKCKLMNGVLSDALDLINRQQAEIERLQESIELMKGAKCVYSYDGETLEYCTASPCPVYKTAEQIKTEAIKEFAKKLRQKIAVMVCSPDLLTLDDYDQCIDDVLKEMEE